MGCPAPVFYAEATIDNSNDDSLPLKPEASATAGNTVELTKYCRPTGLFAFLHYP